MVINLTAVLQDGSALRPGLPANTRTPIRVVRGTDVLINVYVFRPSGAPVNLTIAGTSLVMSIQRQPSDQNLLFNSAGLPGTVNPANMGTNVARFTIANTAWKTVSAGLYGYDVQLTQPGPTKDVVIPLSPFFIEETEAKV